MTRIIAGRAGGRRLQTPRGNGTRPTSDRVREALFSAVFPGDGSPVPDGSTCTPAPERSGWRRSRGAPPPRPWSNPTAAPPH
ncbi:MAG: RsmD family RNA methyltransferase [Nostocoides sp.]